jgi:PPOX class probable F420-dependent enzyme
MAAPLLALGDEQFVSLTTFRRTGVGVATPVWVGRYEGPEGPFLVVTTISTTGKAKRIRNDPHVTLVPCTRRGEVAPGAVPVDGAAVLVTDPTRVSELGAVLLRKYGLPFRLLTLVGRLPRKNPGDRVMLKIRPA